MSKPAAILDIDGTLVDTNYQHTVAWYRAFLQSGKVLPLWRIHRHIGMGGDQLVASLAGEEFDEELGDDVRAAEKVLYMALIDEVRPFADARALLEHLKAQGHAVVLASSAKPDEVEHYLDLLDARDLADDWTHSGDVERTKPHPDLVAAAVEKARRRRRRDDRRLDVGLRGGRKRAKLAYRRRADRRVQRERTPRSRCIVRVLVAECELLAHLAETPLS